MGDVDVKKFTAPEKGTDETDEINEADDSLSSIIAYRGELMLTGWSDTSTRGRTVTFLVPEDSPEHPFKSFQLRQGKRSGTRFMAVLVQIGDDELPVEQQQQTHTLSQQAAILCKDPRFYHWCTEHSFDTVTNEDGARYFILSLCQIVSRSELDKNTRAANTFTSQILNPFTEYIRTVEAQL